MGFGIQNVRVENGENDKDVQRVSVEFGDHHRIEIVDCGGHATVRLANSLQQITLRAGGPQCQFERAINLLRLHMPDAAAP